MSTAQSQKHTPPKSSGPGLATSTILVRVRHVKHDRHRPHLGTPRYSLEINALRGSGISMHIYTHSNLALPLSGAGGGALVYTLMQCMYTSSHSNLSPTHLLMAGVKITASETPCSLTPSCDGTVQRPPNVRYASSQGLTHPLTPSLSSQAVGLNPLSSVSQTSCLIPKLQVSMQSMGFSPATIIIIPSYSGIGHVHNVIIHNIMNNKNVR